MLIFLVEQIGLLGSVELAMQFETIEELRDKLLARQITALARRVSDRRLTHYVPLCELAENLVVNCLQGGGPLTFLEQGAYYSVRPPGAIKRYLKKELKKKEQ